MVSGWILERFSAFDMPEFRIRPQMARKLQQRSQQQQDGRSAFKATSASTGGFWTVVPLGLFS